MYRVFLLLMAVGAGLGFFGYQEHKVSSNTSSEPAPVDLMKLEFGVEPPHNHVELGEHVAIYDELVYCYDDEGIFSSEPTDSTRMNYVFYPIVSTAHPFAKAVQQLMEKGEESLTEQDEKDLMIDKFKVLVRTNRFRTVGDLPEEPVRTEEKVKGLIVNQISSLDWEEKALLRDSFPDLNFDELIILQENRKPSSPLTSFGMMAGGGMLFLIGCALAIFTWSN